MDGLGNPVRLLLTGGETADITQAQALIDGFDALAIVADKGYDSDAFVISIAFATQRRPSRAVKTASLAENTITIPTKTTIL